MGGDAGNLNLIFGLLFFSKRFSLIVKKKSNLEKKKSFKRKSEAKYHPFLIKNTPHNIVIYFVCICSNKLISTYLKTLQYSIIVTFVFMCVSGRKRSGYVLWICVASDFFNAGDSDFNDVLHFYKFVSFTVHRCCLCLQWLVFTWAKCDKEVV